MQSELEVNKAEQRKGRMVFVMLAVFFCVPILVVVLMIKFNWKPTGQSVGELVNPPRLIVSPSTLMDNNGNLQTKFWEDRWSMVLVANQCEKDCMDRLHDIRQIHVSTYKDIFRVQRVLITKQLDVDKIQNQYPKLIIINQTTQDVENIAQQFNVKNEDALVSNRVYFVDPLGHIMMSYPLSIQAADIRKDLVRLLKYSWAG